MKYDFSHLEVKAGKIVRYPLTDIGTPEGTLDEDGNKLRHPYLMLRPATRENKPYWSLSVKRAGQKQRTKIDEAALAEGREEDLDLLPKYVVAGWGGVFDSEDNPVTFSEEECRGFLAALPEWIFAKVRIFAKDTTNFLDEDVPSLGEVINQGNV